MGQSKQLKGFRHAYISSCRVLRTEYLGIVLRKREFLFSWCCPRAKPFLFCSGWPWALNPGLHTGLVSALPLSHPQPLPVFYCKCVLSKCSGSTVLLTTAFAPICANVNTVKRANVIAGRKFFPHPI